MYQLIHKSWGLTETGRPVRLMHFTADSEDDLLPSNVPTGSECVYASGDKKIYFGESTGWVTIKSGGEGAQIDDETVSPSSCWSSEKTSEELDVKPDKDGVYPSFVAGDLAGRDGDAVPALFSGMRAAGGSADIGSGFAEIRKIKGNTVKTDDGLVSFTGNGLKTVGFNLFDKSKTVFGEVATAEGFDDTHPNLAHSDYIKAIPNTEYHVENTFGMVFGYAVVYYDANKGVIGGHYEPTEDRFTEVNFTTPALCDSFIVNFWGEEAVDDVCVNLSHSGYRDGEYEPYWENVLSLPISTYFSDGMRGVGTVHDELTKTKAIKRFGIADLGSLDYTAVSGSTYNYFASSDISDIKQASSTTAVGNIICAKYLTDSVRNIYVGADMSIGVNNSNARVWIKDDNYTYDTAGAAELKADLQGVYLVYELDEPTVTSINPPLDLSYRVDDFGTEEVLSEGLTAPMNAEIAYALNAVDTIRNLPKNYISKASMDNFTEALGEALGKVITATWSEDGGVYLFEITEREDE